MFFNIIVCEIFGIGRGERSVNVRWLEVKNCNCMGFVKKFVCYVFGWSYECVWCRVRESSVGSFWMSSCGVYNCSSGLLVVIYF